MALSGGLHITSANQQVRRPKLMIAVGVDTHKEQHLAVALDALGQLLAERTITTDTVGYRQFVDWLGEQGEIRVGIEGAGSYGAGLCEHLQDQGVEVFEVERPRRRERRTGKSDRLDALLAAKKVLANDGLSTPRGSGKRLALQMLLAAHRSRRR
jgi:transposase